MGIGISQHSRDSNSDPNRNILELVKMQETQTVTQTYSCKVSKKVKVDFFHNFSNFFRQIIFGRTVDWTISVVKRKNFLIKEFFKEDH